MANRRNRNIAARTWADLAQLNDALRVKETVKATIWPKPDYKQLIDDGMKPMVAHLVKQVYDSVAAKPQPSAGGILDDARLQTYVAALNRIERGLMQWVNDRNSVSQWAKANARVAAAMLGTAVPVSELATESRTLLESVFPGGWKAYRNETMVAGGNRLLGALQPGYEEVRRAVKGLEAGWPEKREAWEVQGYRVVENPPIEIHQASHDSSRFFVTVANEGLPSGGFDSRQDAEAAAVAIRPFVLFGKRGFVDSFASHEEALEAARSRSTREKGAGVSEKGKKVESIEREGIVRRLEGEDISSERLMTEFGFKGVNFGNWMKTPSARIEAQLHLNHAFDSLHDLADLLNIPPKAISLNGMLGLAIGAQGAGGSHAAHFVPGIDEINLTRTRGAGSLGHEWGHGVDHYFAKQAGLATAAEPFLTEHAMLSAFRDERKVMDGKLVSQQVPRFTGIRPEILTAFRSIVDAMDQREQSSAEAAKAREERLTKARRAQENWLKSIERDFAGMEPAFEVLAERVRHGDVGDGHVAASRVVYLSPVVAEMRELYKQTHGRIYSLDQSKGLQYWIDAVRYEEARGTAEVEHVPVKVATEFAVNARALDKEKGGKQYWATKLEKFARAFDAFVSDELEARGIRNGYLSHQGRVGPTVPMGTERDATNAAFRQLVGVIKTQETDRGVALFSLGGAGSAVKPEFKPVDVESAEFKRWFGDWTKEDDARDHVSQVTDNGAPRVMYHASYRDFSEFDRLKSIEWRRHHSMDTVGSWFSDTPGDGGAGMYVGSGDGAVIYPVYLNIKNPKHYASFGEFLDDMHTAAGRRPDEQKPKGRGTTDELRQELKAQGYDGITFARTYSGKLRAKLDEAMSRVADAEEAEWAAKRADRAPLTSRRQRLEREADFLRQKLHGNESTEFDNQKVYIAFESTQIKSAISNTHEFGEQNGNILHRKTATPAQCEFPDGIPPEKLKTMVRAMQKSWASMPRVNVVQTAAELPFGGSDKADGFYTKSNGQVYLVAGNVRSTEQFYKVMAHECILHHSLEEMLGAYGFSKLHAGVQALKENGDPVVTRLAAEVHAAYGEVSDEFPVEHETREIVARAGEECLDEKGNLKIGFGFMKSVFAGVTNWLRDHGIPVPFTKTELQGLMHDACRWIKAEHESKIGLGESWPAGEIALNSFAGIRAENAPIDRLRVAREMQLDGVDDRQIWRETGWTFGFADGKPRFELSDVGMSIDPQKQQPEFEDLDRVARQLYGVPLGRLPFGDDGALGDQRMTVVTQANAEIDGTASVIAGNVHNSSVLQGYPQLGKLGVSIHVNDGERLEGSYSASGINAEAPRGKIASVVVHELQHAVQEVEGFARGGTVDALTDIDCTEQVLARIHESRQLLYSQNDEFYRDVVKATQLMIALQDKYGSLANCGVGDPLVQEWWSAIDRRDEHRESSEWFSLMMEENQVKRDGVIVTAHEQYHRLAGEVEARLTEKRLGMSTPERVNSYPVDDMDVAVKEQIVVFRDGLQQQQAVCEGQYSGKILDVNDGLAVQKTGRSGECVRHTLSRLSAPVRIGDVVDIAYQDGRGVVAGLGQAREVTRY